MYRDFVQDTGYKRVDRKEELPYHSQFNHLNSDGTMKSFLTACCLVASALATTRLLRGMEAKQDYHEDIVRAVENGHRDLQLINVVCDIFEFLLPGTPSCVCLLTLGLQFTCDYDTPICDGGLTGFCTTPRLTGEIGIFPPSATLTYNTTGSTNGGVEVPGISLKFGGSLGSVIGDSTEGNLNFCEAESEGEPCESCTICDKGFGFQFSCANVHSELKQSACVGAKIIDSFSADQEHAHFLPHLDD